MGKNFFFGKWVFCLLMFLVCEFIFCFVFSSFLFSLFRVQIFSVYLCFWVVNLFFVFGSLGPVVLFRMLLNRNI
jgi:hypothetical protein